MLNVIIGAFESYLMAYFFPGTPKERYYDQCFQMSIDSERLKFSCFNLHSIENDLALIFLGLVLFYSTFAGDQTLYNASMTRYIYIALIEID